jgi:predicted transcriptional regulator
MQKMISTLTDRQRYWLEHVQACEASGKSIAEYATDNGVHVRAMYSGKKMLVNKGVLPATQPTRFQRVQVVEVAAGNQWRIALPNGVSVAFAGEVDAQALSAVLSVSASVE